MPAPSTPRQGAFISYARADGQAAAFALLSRLQADAPDVPAWLDRQQMEGGVGWWAQIEQALDRAEFLIVLMTPAAMRSVHTRQEWRAARQRGVCVYPVMGVPADELDFNELPAWMRKRHAYDPAHEWPTLLAHLRRGCEATRVPFMAPPLPAHLVPRPRETEALLGLLLQPETDGPVAITTALRGAGGFGKTTLAIALCHHDRCIEHFDDGILWVTLGQAPNLLNELIKLHAALTGERPGFVDVEDAARELARCLEHRHCLLVLDNAWSAAHVRPFLQAVGAGSCLITTRLFELVQDAQRVDVDRMTGAEGLQLLRVRLGPAAPAGPGAEDEALRRLVARLGEWPLPIKLAASTMRQRIARGDTLAHALDYVGRALDKHGPTAFDDTEQAVGATLRASLAMLDDAAQQRCAELAIFTPMWSGLTPTLNRQLLDRELDLVVCTEAPAGGTRHRPRPLFGESWVAVFPKRHPLPPGVAGRGLLDAAAGLPLIRYSGRSVIGQQIERWLVHVGAEAPRRFEFDATDPLLSLVAAGLGWAISTPLCLQQSRHHLDEVRVLPLPRTRPGQREFFLIGQGAETDAVADEIVRVTRQVLRRQIVPALRTLLPALPPGVLRIPD